MLVQEEPDNERDRGSFLSVVVEKDLAMTQSHDVRESVGVISGFGEGIELGVGGIGEIEGAGVLAGADSGDRLTTGSGWSGVWLGDDTSDSVVDS